MVRVKLNIILLAIVAGIIAFNIYMSSVNNNTVIIRSNNTFPITTTTYLPTNIRLDCNTDSECGWISTNCCSENSGAQWQCANKQSYVDCQSKQVLCPQNVTSSKPTQSCSCISGRCSP